MDRKKSNTVNIMKEQINAAQHYRETYHVYVVATHAANWQVTMTINGIFIHGNTEWKPMENVYSRGA